MIVALVRNITDYLIIPYLSLNPLLCLLPCANLGNPSQPAGVSQPAPNDTLTVYLNNILIYLQTKKEYKKHIKQVLSYLKQHNL